MILYFKFTTRWSRTRFILSFFGLGSIMNSDQSRRTHHTESTYFVCTIQNWSVSSRTSMHTEPLRRYPSKTKSLIAVFTWAGRTWAWGGGGWGGTGRLLVLQLKLVLGQFLNEKKCEEKKITKAYLVRFGLRLRIQRGLVLFHFLRVRQKFTKAYLVKQTHILTLHFDSVITKAKKTMWSVFSLWILGRFKKKPEK